MVYVQSFMIFLVYSLNLTFRSSYLFMLVFWFICWISLFDHHNKKRESIMFFIHFTWGYSRKCQWKIMKVVITNLTIFSFCNNRWGYLVKSVGHWGSYCLKQDKPLQTLKITHNYLILLFYYHFLGSISHHIKVHRVDIWLYWDFFGARGEILCGKVLAI